MFVGFVVIDFVWLCADSCSYCCKRIAVVVVCVFNCCLATMLAMCRLRRLRCVDGATGTH